MWHRTDERRSPLHTNQHLSTSGQKLRVAAEVVDALEGYLARELMALAFGRYLELVSSRKVLIGDVTKGIQLPKLTLA